MSPPHAFVSLVNLINRSCLRSFYGGSEDEMQAYYRVFTTLLADYMPKASLSFRRMYCSFDLILSAWK
jgi:TBC1 domain family member 14